MPLPPRLLILAACLPAIAQAVDLEPLPPPPSDKARWEGAIGLISSYAPAYQGSGRTRIKLQPGFFLRCGRFTITNASGFVTRRADDVMRGLGVDLSTSDRLRVNRALRFDAGRSETTDPGRWKAWVTSSPPCACR